MKLYHINGVLFKVENNCLMIFDDKSKQWICQQQVCLDNDPSKFDEPYKFDMVNVDFASRMFINKDGQEIPLSSGPHSTLGKLEWIKWFKRETDCSLKDALEVFNTYVKFCSEH